MSQYNGVENNKIAETLKEVVKFLYQLNIGESFDKPFAGWNGKDGYIHAINQSQSDQDLAEVLSKIGGLSMDIYVVLEAVAGHADKALAKEASALIQKMDEFQARNLKPDLIFATVYTQFDRERDAFLQKAQDNEPIETRPVLDVARPLTIKPLVP